MKRMAVIVLGVATVVGCAPSLEQSFFFLDVGLPLVPSSFGLAFERFDVPAAEGAVISASWIPADNAVGTVIYSTGRGGNQSVDLTINSGTFTLVHSMDYNVVTYDYPGVGASGGTTSLDALGPALRAVLDHTRARNTPGTNRIVLMGLSLGAMVTSSVAAEQPDALVGVILIATPELDTSPTLVSALRAELTGATSALREAGLDSLDNIRRINVPLLMLHSVHDNVVPIAGAERIFEAAPEPKTFIELRGNALSSLLFLSPHILYLQDNGPHYSEPIRTFLLDLATK